MNELILKQAEEELVAALILQCNGDGLFSFTFYIRTIHKNRSDLRFILHMDDEILRFQLQFRGAQFLSVRIKPQEGLDSGPVCRRVLVYHDLSAVNRHRA